MKVFLRILFCCSVLLAFSGCNDSTKDNANESSDGEITIPGVENQTSDIVAMDFLMTFPIHENKENITVNFSRYVKSELGKNLRLESVIPKSNNPSCEIVNINKELIEFSIPANSAKTCLYNYTVSDGISSNSGLARITVTATQSDVNNSKAEPRINSALPAVSKSTVLGESLVFDLSDELSSELALMENPLFSESIEAYGTGVPVLSENGMVSYEAIAVGYSLSYFYILDDQNTPNDKTDDVVYNGTLIISVSGNINSAPTVPDVIEPGVTYPALETHVFDLSPYVSDIDNDEIQLIAVSSEGIDVKVSAPLDVENLSFDFYSEDIGQFTINYVVYDHEKAGVAAGVVKVNIDTSFKGKAVASNWGTVKLYQDGTFDYFSTEQQFIDYLQVGIVDYVETNSLKVDDVVQVGISTLLFQLSNGESYLQAHCPPDYPSTSTCPGGQIVRDNVKATYGGVPFGLGSGYEYTLFVYNDGSSEAIQNQSLASEIEGTEGIQSFNSANVQNIELVNMTRYPLWIMTTKDNELWVTDFRKGTTNNLGNSQALNEIEFLFIYDKHYLALDNEHRSVELDFLDSQEYNAMLVGSVVDRIEELEYREFVVLTNEGTLYSFYSSDRTSSNIQRTKVADNVKEISTHVWGTAYVSNDDVLNVYQKQIPEYLIADTPEDLYFYGKLPTDIDIDKRDNISFFSMGFGGVYFETSDDTGLHYWGTNGYQKLSNNKISKKVRDGVNVPLNGAVKANLENPTSADNIAGRGVLYGFDETEQKYVLFHPMKNDLMVENEVGCSTPSESVVDGYITSANYYIDFCGKFYVMFNNGQFLDVDGSPVDKKSSDRLDYSDSYEDIIDVDNDGISTAVEKKMVTNDLLDSNLYQGFNPVLWDSDSDGVSDGFENTYRGSYNNPVVRRWSHEIQDGGVKDSFKDKNEDGFPDFIK